MLTADARAACVLTGPSVIWCPPSPSAAGSSPPRPSPAPSRRPLVGRRPLPRSGVSLSLSAPGPRSALIGFHGVVCWCHAARPLGASVYLRASGPPPEEPASVFLCPRACSRGHPAAPDAVLSQRGRARRETQLAGWVPGCAAHSSSRGPVGGSPSRPRSTPLAGDPHATFRGDGARLCLRAEPAPGEAQGQPPHCTSHSGGGGLFPLLRPEASSQTGSCLAHLCFLVCGLTPTFVA